MSLIQCHGQVYDWAKYLFKIGEKLANCTFFGLEKFDWTRAGITVVLFMLFTWFCG